ncbi:hypothetical protein SISSUDRAFT_1064672 [Sistotremastrum suecicum HHB10207 ss-3]|uniref:Uncharacterized protein n=1 Tax=Sistotremastrum suecicum HHB10207 ss-3 TaxID=1314776 RepID=A0A166ACW5_9AGAM|nr:hypothetical protein SISSUDRAFT_1064672 [Sistotremastrum suecicum HHB10207 ss-3]
MSSTTALKATGLASTYWRDSKGVDHVRVYYQDNNGAIREVKWDAGQWTDGSTECFAKRDSLGTPLAVITLPEDLYSESTSNVPGANPEIRIYCLKLEEPPSIQEFIKPKNKTTWGSSPNIIPTYNLSVTSRLAAIEYGDPHIRVYYQDKSGFIRQAAWNSQVDVWVGSADDLKVSSTPVLDHTPISAAVGVNYPLFPEITVAWLDRNDNVAAAAGSWRDEFHPLEFSTTYSASSFGNLTVAAWHGEKAVIWYNGQNNQRVQKVEYSYATDEWKGPITAFSGNITQSSSAGQGSLAAVAFASAVDGALGSVFYQPYDDDNIVEIAV